MTETELNSYRFLSEEDPSDEMLARIMCEVTADAIESKKRSDAKYKAMMEKHRSIMKSKWNNRINRYIND